MRILIADDDPRVRSALQMLLRQEPGLILAGESSDLEGLLIEVGELEPDLVLLDWELPGRPAAALVGALCKLNVKPRVIVFSRRPESEPAALAAGADAFVSKADPPEQLLTALRRLVER